jgi:cytochrome c553
MKKFVLFLLFLSGFALVSAAQKESEPLLWAYVVRPPDYKDPVDDGRLLHVPDSTGAWTFTQVQDFYFAADWHPADHPTMPGVVAHGRKPEVFACGFCHRADGAGGPENANLKGLPEAYLVQQMADFKSGARKSLTPQRRPPAAMIAVAKGATGEEVESAAAYFSELKPRKVITVVETDSVPKTHVVGWVLSPVNPLDKEPIGPRIIETPKNVEQFESRDSRSEFIAYVPVGSVAKGESLVKTGDGGKTTPCGICHGPDLKGLGPIPGIAGRSPSYIFRQLYDIQHGYRKGPGASLMSPVLAKLSQDDLISVTAYTASLAP